MNISFTAPGNFLLRGACFIILITFSATAFAQTPSSTAKPPAAPAPNASPTPSLEKKFLVNILQDQRTIWLSPFHAERSDVRWLAPLGVSTAVLLATDRHTSAELLEGGNHPTRLRISADISRLGEFYTTGGAAAAFYFVGRATHNARARETGLLSAEALIDSGIVTSALKLASQRPRPNFDNGRGDFRDDGDSFPSGHATSAWALAAVVGQEYKKKPIVKWGAYGIATAVSISRYTGRNHFLSDVLVGSAIGYGVGRYVYRTHHDKSLDADDNETTTTSITRSKYFPLIAPEYSHVARVYGVRLAWSF
jgi:membrane-associated phospholipid phosphatase